jgi:DNA polymerase III delta subunit
MGKIRSSGANPDKYRTKLKKEILSFRFNKFYSYSKNFSVDDIESALLKIQEADYLMKTSGGDQNSLLIELLDGIIGRK